MTHEHTGHCCGHEAAQQSIQAIERLGALCCAGPCNHFEHQPSMHPQNMWELQLNAMSREKKPETTEAKKKRKVRKGFMASLLVAPLQREAA